MQCDISCLSSVHLKSKLNVFVHELGTAKCSNCVLLVSLVQDFVSNRKRNCNSNLFRNTSDLNVGRTDFYGHLKLRNK